MTSRKLFLSLILILLNFKVSAQPNDSTGNDTSIAPFSSSENTNTTSSKSRRSTEIEWNDIPGAKSFEIEITPLDRKDGVTNPFLFTTLLPKWSGELKPGKYSMRLRSKDKRSVPGEWSKSEVFYVKLYAPQPKNPLENDVIKTNENENSELTFQWEKQSEASLYKIHIEDESKTFSQDLESTSNKLSIKLPVARKYSWYLKGFDKQGNEGEPMDNPIPFTLLGKKLSTPKIAIPETAFVREIKWTSVPYAETYVYEFFRRGANRKWKKILREETNQTQIPFDSSWKGGEYKLSVQAIAPLRESSKIHSIRFEVAQGARTIAAEQFALLRKSIDRTNNWYFTASYLITQINYTSTNWDEGKAAQFKGLGGTGRLGFGYLDKATPYGFLGVLEYSGFIISNNVYKYPTIEVHGIYRWVSDNAGEFRASSGLYYKELPEIISQNNENTEFKLFQIKALGLHAGGEYWFPLNSKLGLQTNARIYIPLQGQVPNGEKLTTAPSYQLGFLGSLRLNKKATGLVGIAYRKDIIKYGVSDALAKSEGHSTNDSSVDGTYLNFYLEWDI